LRFEVFVIATNFVSENESRFFWRCISRYANDFVAMETGIWS